jgi:D-alanine--D-alanine ligase
MTATPTTADVAAILAAAERLAAAGESGPRAGRDPVNLPMIRNWIEAIGDTSPVWTDEGAAVAAGHGGLVAPPAMIQVWTMPGLHRGRGDDDPLGQMSQALDEAGFTSVVATNCDQVYHRYLRHGEQVSVRGSLLDVTGPKRTALGEGWFVTTRSTWYAGDEPVATMDFRILKFRPRPPAAPAGAVLRPPASPDTAFFWAGTAAGELRIQECGQCGARRHPPGPMCPQCGAAQRREGGGPGYIVAAGTGTVYSYVVHHHPPVPGKTLPLVIALVELPEGVRVLADMPGTDPAQVEIGTPVRVGFERIDDELTLPVWHPAAGEAGRASAGAAGAVFPTSDAGATKERRRSEEGRQRLPAALSEPASTVLSDVDVVLPIIHGPFGEDGSLQGLLEMAGIKYVGAGVLASAVGIDKEYMKLIFAGRGLPVVRHVVVRERDWPLPGAGEATPESKRVLDAIAELGWPLFVKPARGGSSIGTSKASDMGQLHESIELARQFDRKVLVEAAVDGVEIEVSVLEGVAGGPPDTSLPGQMMIEGEDEFYDFGTKYLDPEDRMAIPAPIPAAAADEIRRLAAEAFEAVSCEGLARVDFFYTADGKILINEINTLPGMTPTSYFQKLWEASGLPFDQLLDRVIQTALAKRPGLC